MVNKLDLPRYVMVGDVADVQRHRAQAVLRKQGVNPSVVFEFSATEDCTICGVAEVINMLREVLPTSDSMVWALEEGDGARVKANEVVLRVSTPANSLIVFQSAITGILAASSGWATAARQCSDAGGDTRVAFNGTHYMHPNVIPQMEYAAAKGGCVAVSTSLGSRLADITPYGTTSSFLVTLMGDVQSALEAFDLHMPPEVPRIARLGVFKDEVEDLALAINAAETLSGVHIRIPGGRRAISPVLLEEIRARLKLSNSESVDISVSGDLTPEKIAALNESGAPVDAFVVGSYIAKAPPITFQSHIKEIAGDLVMQRGVVPGLSNNPRLIRVSLQSSGTG